MSSLAHRSAVFGLAVLPETGRGSHLYVFHARVEALAAEHPDLNHGTILGHVLAHEIGHLLLGSNSHAPGGLMGARWFARELHRMSQGDLLFTSAEPARVRAALAARMAEEAAEARPAPTPEPASGPASVSAPKWRGWSHLARARFVRDRHHRQVR